MIHNDSRAAEAARRTLLPPAPVRCLPPGLLLDLAAIAAAAVSSILPDPPPPPPPRSSRCCRGILPPPRASSACFSGAPQTRLSPCTSLFLSLVFDPLHSLPFELLASFVKQMMRKIALQKEFLRQPSLCGLLSSKHVLPLFFRHQSYSTDNGNSGRNSDNSFESSDDFERRLFGDISNNEINDSFYRKLDKLEKAHGRSGIGSKLNSDDSRIIDGISDSFNSLSDGMDEKLKEAARTFVFSDEIHDENYKFRPDVTFYPGMTYTTRDLDLTKPGVQKRFKRNEFETTTQEVLKKADFRNVRFLSNFLTEAGIIIKRSKTRISAKAQRKVAREIKTARAFGLMPFTTMGTKPFIFGRSMKDEAEDYYEHKHDTATTATDPQEES